MSLAVGVAFGLLSAWPAQSQSLPNPPVSPAPVVNYEYDAQGNPTKTIQASGGLSLTTQSTYDALNRRKDSTDAKASVTRFGYDGLDRILQVTDPRNLATYSYDASNRLTSVVYSQAGQPSLSFGWSYDQVGTGFSNGKGRLTSTTHPNGSTQYSHDVFGRVLTDTQRVNAVTGAISATIVSTVGYAYDSAGRVSAITYPSGVVLAYAYTGGQLSGISVNAAGTVSPLLSQDSLVRRDGTMTSKAGARTARPGEAMRTPTSASGTRAAE